MKYRVKSYNKKTSLNDVNELIENVSLVEIKGNIVIFYDSQSKGIVIATFCLENVFIKKIETTE